MTPSLFFYGIVIGFLIAAPVGPVGVLCIRRALNDGRVAAFVAGLGAALADTFYGAVAGFGLNMVSGFLIDHQIAVQVVGGLFLVVLGGRTLLAPPPDGEAPTGRAGLVQDFVSTLMITLTNPATILAFMGIFAAFGTAARTDTWADSGLLVAGVFTGSALWWLTLSALASAARDRFSPRWLARLNRISGAVLLLFGGGILLRAAVG